MPIQSRAAAISPKGMPHCTMPNGPGFMPYEDNLLGTVTEAAKIDFMRRPSVVERIVQVRDRRREAHAADAGREGLRGRDQAFCASVVSFVSFHGATLKRSNMPGTASTKQSQKKSTQPSCSTSQPAEALMKVRGTAARLVNSANWVAV